MNANEINQDAIDFAATATSPAPEPTATELALLLKEHGTKSGVIRHLTAQGWKRGRIAKFMGIRYQHVRNVLTQQPKKSS